MASNCFAETNKTIRTSIYINYIKLVSTCMYPPTQYSMAILHASVRLQAKRLSSDKPTFMLVFTVFFVRHI